MLDTMFQNIDEIRNDRTKNNYSKVSEPRVTNFAASSCSCFVQIKRKRPHLIHGNQAGNTEAGSEELIRNFYTMP